MKVGVIGVGNMGKNHVRVYRELGTELVGVADINFDVAQNIAAQYKTKAYSDYNELLAKGLDAVSIAVPTTRHKAIALAAIQKGVNLLIEKPIADSVENAQELIKAAKSHKVKLMVGHIERFNPAVRTLKEIIDDGVLGDLVYISAKRVGPFVPRVSDVGIIIDMATHDIDVIRYFIGKECTSVFARSTRWKNVKGDAAIILMGFGEVSASVEVNWYTPHRERNLAVTGTKGVAYLDYIKQEIEIFKAEWKMIPEVPRAEPLKLELEHFLDCVGKDKEPLVSGTDGLKALEIAIKAGQVSGSEEKNL
ncbi:MAG: Gfo/Idh/MocA family oxidoreductase [Dehalococcoidales bacterium]